MITQKRLKEILDYNPDTGTWTRKKCEANRYCEGMEAGYIHKGTGYKLVRADGEKYKSSRLAFLYMTGKWPKSIIDHIDRDRTNDSWNNLREATLSENNINRSIPKNNTSGVKGITWNKKQGKWKVYISLDKERKHLGYFSLLEDAIIARKEAEKIYHT